MKVEIEVPPLPVGWGNDIEFGYGKAPPGSILLVRGRWTESQGLGDGWIYAVKPWVPKIVTAGVLEPGWIVIDPDGAYWYSYSEPDFDESALEWAGNKMERLYLKESPSIAGRNAIWRIK